MPPAARHAHVPPRRRWHSRVVTPAVVGVVLAGGAGCQALRASDGCEPRSPVLEVVAPPDIAPAVGTVLEGDADLRASGDCATVSVRAQADADVLAGLARGGAPTPDVWIPSSSSWVDQSRAGELVHPRRQSSIASSPLVVAVSPAVAHRLPGGGLPGWEGLVTAGSDGGLVLQLPDPPSSPAAVSTVLMLGATVGDQPGGRTALTGLLRNARVQTGPGTGADVLAALPSDGDGAIPVPEQAVWAHRGRDGAAALVAVYPRTGGTPFDYPFTVLATDGSVAAKADRLLAALRADHGQDRLLAAGFRGMDGAGRGLTPARGVDGSRSSPVVVPDADAVERVVHLLGAVRQDARLLAVLDVSGSMAADAPGPEGTTRLDLATDAAAAGLALYPDTTEVGLWSFSEELTPTADHQELVPIRPLVGPTAVGRRRLLGALTGLQPVPDGGTALYDTTLAAVRTVRQGWDPARVNAVVLLSDGEDTDDTGIGLDELLMTLRAEQASGRPVPVISIAYGAGSDAEVLGRISEVTGGASYRTTDPARISEVLLDAVGQRACRPRCPSSATG